MLSTARNRGEERDFIAVFNRLLPVGVFHVDGNEYIRREFRMLGNPGPYVVNSEGAICLHSVLLAADGLAKTGKILDRNHV